MYRSIADPHNGKQVSINSSRGKLILRNYLNILIGGGDHSKKYWDSKVDEPVDHQVDSRPDESPPIDELGDCPICFGPSDIKFIGCGHTQCRACAEQNPKSVCPICRAPYNGHFKVNDDGDKWTKDTSPILVPRDDAELLRTVEGILNTHGAAALDAFMDGLGSEDVRRIWALNRLLRSPILVPRDDMELERVIEGIHNNHGSVALDAFMAGLGREDVRRIWEPEWESWVLGGRPERNLDGELIDIGALRQVFPERFAATARGWRLNVFAHTRWTSLMRYDARRSAPDQGREESAMPSSPSPLPRSSRRGSQRPVLPEGEEYAFGRTPPPDDSWPVWNGEDDDSDL